jgi:hypothetical protein
MHHLLKSNLSRNDFYWVGLGTRPYFFIFINFRVFRNFRGFLILGLKEKRAVQPVVSFEESIFSWSLCPGRALPCPGNVRNSDKPYEEGASRHNCCIAPNLPGLRHPGFCGDLDDLWKVSVLEEVPS